LVVTSTEKPRRTRDTRDVHDLGLQPRVDLAYGRQACDGRHGRDIAVVDRVESLARGGGENPQELDSGQGLLREARDPELPAADGSDRRVGTRVWEDRHVVLALDRA